MFAKDLRALDKAQLESQLGSLLYDLVGLQENVRLGKEKNHRQLRRVRRDIARVRTCLREQEAKNAN